MKTIQATRGQRFLIGVLLLGLLLAPATGLVMAQGPEPPGGDTPQDVLGSSFTYQGRLKNASGLVNSTCDFRFSLWDALSGGTQQGTTQTKTNATVSEGLFTVELNGNNEFGSRAFSGDARWLQIAVRCPAGSGTYATLSPRQPLTAAPYALSLRPGAYIHNTASSGDTTGIGFQSDHGDGVYVWATGDGVYVYEAGNQSIHQASPANNGFEVTGAEGYGLYVGYAGEDGVHVKYANGHGVYANASGTGIGVLGKSLSGSGVRGETSAAGMSGVYGWNGGSGSGVTGFSSNGVALTAVGTGVIYSTADSVLYLSPHDMVVRQDPALVSVTPWPGGGVRVRNESGTGTRYLSIPVPTFGTLFGSQVYVKALEVCYKVVGFFPPSIAVTTVSKNNGSETGVTHYIYDDTSQGSTDHECYTLNASTPRVPIDNSTWVQFNMEFLGSGSDWDIYIYTVKLTLTEQQN